MSFPNLEYLMKVFQGKHTCGSGYSKWNFRTVEIDQIPYMHDKRNKTY